MTQRVGSLVSEEGEEMFWEEAEESSWAAAAAVSSVPALSDEAQAGREKSVREAAHSETRERSLIDLRIIFMMFTLLYLKF